ncbi:MAG: 2-hydroxyhepta-2,4-diene,7-dioate isomerase [Burkholderiales bacterium]|jgi:2-keto-4-pentenoate hydratase/2-oxohepta-3-ene-1,7-dioic acid hydratase in catechol pathway|nr:2-hydroxyhepta-2,4-diene,7-dioate isomerase [Burkholderiales bacterium]
MKLCRFDNDRLGIVEGGEVLDVTAALEAIPALRWPLPPGDAFIANLDAVLARARSLASRAPRRPLSEVRLRPPVANPSKIVNAPINYQAHIDEAKRDQGIAHGRDIKTIADWGLFLKSSSSLAGAGDEIRLRFPERRNDHEVELAVIIGREANRVPRSRALDCVCGYSIGLDMTLRGAELPSFRKSIDTYSVLAPWLVTRDEVPDPNALDLWLTVNGEARQRSNTRRMVYDVPRLIEYATSFYTLYPGDLIFSGTPEGVGPVKPGDEIRAGIESIGEFSIRVAADYAG